MSVDGSKPFCLVAGLSFTDAGAYAFEQAVRIARRIPGCALHLIHVVDGESSESETRELAGHLQLYADQSARRLGGLDGLSVGVHVRTGDPAEELARFVGEVAADLMIAGSHRGLFRRDHSSPTVMRLGELVSCPVVVAGPKPKPKAKAEPAIEPPCPDCVRTRAASNGSRWWCARHEEHAVRRHIYSYQGEWSFRTHDSGVTPTGVDGN